MQQRKAIMESGSDESVFVDFKEESYLKKMQSKAQELNLYDAEQLTPKILEQSPYKLHVSLQSDEYAKHKDNIKKIIITHLEGGAINDFKLINDNVLKANIESATKIANLITEYKSILENKEIPTHEWENKFLNALEDYFGRKPGSLPELSTMDEIILPRVTRTIKDGQRLLEGDQFTIYVPEIFDNNIIHNLCNDLNTYLEQNNVSPGKLLDVESPIGKYINLRQEYLMEDFHAVNDSGFMNMDKRINSAKIYDNDIENERRKRVVLEQEESALYKYINNNLTQSPSLQHTSIFQPASVERKEEPNQQKKLDM